MPPKLTEKALYFNSLVETKKDFERSRAADSNLEIKIVIKHGEPTLTVNYTGPDKDLFLHQTMRIFENEGLIASNAPRLRSITPPTSPICREGSWPIAPAGKYKRSKSV